LTIAFVERESSSVFGSDRRKDAAVFLAAAPIFACVSRIGNSRAESRIRQRCSAPRV
jgi:hypothetical protein